MVCNFFNVVFVLLFLLLFCVNDYSYARSFVGRKSGGYSFVVSFV